LVPTSMAVCDGNLTCVKAHWTQPLSKSSLGNLKWVHLASWPTGSRSRDQCVSFE